MICEQSNGQNGELDWLPSRAGMNINTAQVQRIAHPHASFFAVLPLVASMGAFIHEA